MFEVINKQILAENIKRIDILAPDIASKALPGQFVKICPEESDESIPLTISDYDAVRGIITLIFQEDGRTTGKLGSLPIGESVFSILGPLGKAADIEKKGRVVCVATGIGTAQILPICRALKKAGNKVVGIIGAKTKSKLMLEAQLRIACDKIFITTEDGSYVRRGLATEALKEVIGKEKIDLVYAIGNPQMMEAVCSITKKQKIKTLVQLKPIMVDCVGMCGSCRVKVGGKTVMACTDGPEFDGHKVDFKNTIIIMTSNVGARLISHGKSLGFLVQEDIQRDYINIKETLTEEMKKAFNPEFLNRIDDVIVFHPLGKEQIKSIAKIQLASLRARLAEKGYKLTLSAAAMDKLADAGFDPVFGARPLKRAIQVQVENPLAHQLLAGELIPESTIRIDADDSGLFVVSN